MKKWLQKILFFDAPAQGAFFALTLLIAGTYLLWTIVLGFRFTYDSSLILIAVRIFAIPVYLGVVALWFSCVLAVFHCRMKYAELLPFRRWLFPVVAVAVLLLIAALWIIPEGDHAGKYAWLREMPGLAVTRDFLDRLLYGNVLFLSFSTTGLLLLLMLPQPRSALRYSIPALLTGSAALLAVLVTGDNILSSMLRLLCDYRGRFCGWMPVKLSKWVANALDSSAPGWICFLIATLLLAAVSYLLWGKALAETAGFGMRKMFSRKIIVLWILCGIAFAFSECRLGFSMYRAAQIRAEQERSFGRPLTPAAMKEFYLEGQQPDAEFWQAFDHWRKHSLDRQVNIYSLGRVIDIADSAKPLFQAEYAGLADDFAKLDRLISAGFPKSPVAPMIIDYVDFGPGIVQKMNLLSSQLLDRMHCALCLGDAEAARTAFVELIRIGGAQAGNCDYFAWLSTVGKELTAMELLIEAGIPTDPELRHYRARLEEQESRIPLLVKRNLYQGTVEAVNLYRGFRDVTLATGFGGVEPPPAIPFSACGFLLPQVAWLTYREEEIDLLAWAALPGKRLDTNPWRDFPFVYAGPYQFRRYSDATQSFIARCRALGALIGAELYRRRHGEFPEKLEFPPVDPFGGEPMKYRVGNAEIEVTRFVADSDSRLDWERRKESMPVVQVWSVGPNRTDEGGSPFAGNRNDNDDDVCAFFRISGKGDGNGLK